jgi:hypothetical protein
MNKEVLQAEILLTLLTSIGLSIAMFVVVVFLWFLFIQDSLNYIYCLFSESARYRRWDGYYGFLYSEKPMVTKRGNLAIKYMKENNIDIHDLKNGELNIPREYLEPSKEDLGRGINIYQITQ